MSRRVFFEEKRIETRHYWFLLELTGQYDDSIEVNLIIVYTTLPDSPNSLIPNSHQPYPYPFPIPALLHQIYRHESPIILPFVFRRNADLFGS